MKKYIYNLSELYSWFGSRDYCSVTYLKRRRVRSKVDMELKSRENPIVIKLDSVEFKNIFTAEVIDLKKIFDKYNHEIRIAGGAVRDLLLGQQPKDLDFATVATPQQMKDMFTAEDVRMINMNGEKHGTITPRINDKENFEVTTLRVDMITDGRHAEVEFTTDWKLDANRRDLTVNSMFLGFDGSVYDYFFGYEDLQKRKIAFVGDPDVRIKEDYLRIMRYFRFYGRISDKPDNHEKTTLKIIQSNAEGLQLISGERIWIELQKILQGNFSGSLLKTMLSLDIGGYIGLPKNPDLEELNNVLKRTEHLRLHPISYLVALLGSMDDVSVLHNRLKFARYDRDLAYFLIEHRGDKISSSRALSPYERLVIFAKIKQADAISYVREVLKYRGDSILLEQFDKWEIPKFPVGGKILKDCGILPGKKCGAVINKLKEIWFENDYTQSADELVKLIPDILEEQKQNNILR